MNTPTIDPLRRAAELATGTRSSRDGDDATSDTPTDADALEHRLKRDAFDSIGRIKPAVVAGVEEIVRHGHWLATLTASH